MSMSWTRATSTSRSPNAPLSMMRILRSGGTRRDQRRLHRRRAAAGDRDDRVVRRAAEDAAQLAGERHHQLAEHRVAVADVVVDERALDRRGGVDRTGVEQRVVRVALGLEQRGDLVVDVDACGAAPRPHDAWSARRRGRARRARAGRARASGSGSSASASRIARLTIAWPVNTPSASTRSSPSVGDRVEVGVVLARRA